MMTYVVCEDELDQRNEIGEYIKGLMMEIGIDYKVVAYESGEQLLNNYPSEAEVIFLDIQMPGSSGIETAKQIRKFNQEVEIIFITGDPTYMQEGYEVNARRYLLKPLSYEKFVEKVKPCIEKIIERTSQYIWIKSEYSDYKVSIYEIEYAEKIGRKLRIYTTSHFYDTYLSMKELEEMLPVENFFRCHKSYLINLHRIKGLEKEGIIINDQTIPIRRQTMKELKKQLVEVMGEML